LFVNGYFFSIFAYFKSVDDCITVESPAPYRGFNILDIILPDFFNF